MVVAIICAVPAIMTAYAFLHVLVFPEGRFVSIIGADYVIDVIGILAMCSGALMLLVSIPFFIRARVERRLDCSPERQEIVKVVDKIYEIQGMTYYIEFELPDGTRKCVEVDSKQYDAIIQGEVGWLTYKQSKKDLCFIGFKIYAESSKCE